MTRTAPKTRRRRRPGFTLMELIVASFLIALLSMLLILAWKAFGVPAVQVEERTRIALNANLVVETLGRDLSGCLLRKEAISETDLNLIERAYRFEKRLVSEPDHPYPLRLRFKSEDDQAKERTVSYWVDSQSIPSRLIRHDEQGGNQASAVVAMHVTDFQVSPVLENETSLTLSFTVSYREFEGTYSITVNHPPALSTSYPP